MESFLDCKNSLEKGYLNKCAFNYKPKLHDIKKLGSMAGNYNSELLQVFPIATPEQKECFKLLRKAYVDARYDKHYKISKEQLLYLIDRIEKLKEITERICIARISG